MQRLAPPRAPPPTLASRSGGDFHGHTNAGTDQVIRDIASITRPHLNRRGRTESPRERRLSGLRDEEASRGLAAEPAYPLDANTQLQLIFQYYCRFGRTGPRGTAQDTIDSFNFMRLARECPDLLDSRLDRAEVDLIFAKCRSKGQRRLEYRQFLDALAAMAITKYPAEDPVAAFSLLLGHHVFKCAAAEGLREARAIKAREQAEAEDAAWGSADYDSHERAAHDLAGRAGGGGGREGGYGGDGRGRAYGRGPGGGGGDYDAPGGAGEDAWHGRGRPAAGREGSRSPQRRGARGRAADAGSDYDYDYDFDYGSGRESARRAVAAGAPSSVAGAGHAEAHHPVAPPPPPPRSAPPLGHPQQPSPPLGIGSERPDYRLAPSVGAAPALMPAPPSSRASRWEADSRPMTPPRPSARGFDDGSFDADAVADGDPGRTGLRGAPESAAAAAAPGRERSRLGRERTSGRHDGAPGGASWMSPTTASNVAQLRRVERMAADRAAEHAAERAAARESLARAQAQARGPWGEAERRRDAPPAAGRSDWLSAGRGAASRGPAAEGWTPSADSSRAPSPRARSRRASVDDPEAPLERDAVFRGRVRQERRTSTLGSDRFKPTMAGEANRPGGVYDRLSQPSGFTGVYRRAFFTDGRMNASADTGVSSIPTRFRGSTNAGSNETIHSISVALRPGLRSGKSFR